MQSHCTRTQFHASIPKSRFLNGPRVGLLAARPKCGQTASKGLFGLKSQYLVGHAAVVHQPRNLVFTPRAHPREEPPPLHNRQTLAFERGPPLGVVVRIDGPQLPVERLGETFEAVRLAFELHDPLVGPAFALSDSSYYRIDGERREFGNAKPTLTYMAGAAVRLNHLVLDCRFNGAFNKTENYFEGVYPRIKSYQLLFSVGYAF